MTPLPPVLDPAESTDVVAELHPEIGDVDAALSSAAASVSLTFEVQRVQHVHLETHASVGWLDEDGRLVIRSSTQTPFLTRDALVPAVRSARTDRIRVLAGRVGGGFGAKQEMLTEDIVALAVLKLRRPVSLEFTREEQFTAATTRHPMRITRDRGRRRVRAADRARARRPRRHRRLRQPRPRSSLPQLHRGDGALPLPQQACRRGQRLHEHGARRERCAATGSVRRCSRWIRRWTSLRATIGIDPIEFLRLNVIVPGDELVSGQDGEAPQIGSYGLDQCLDAVRAVAGETAVMTHRRRPDGRDWRIGEGVAAVMLHTTPPGGHRAVATIEELGDGDYLLTVGTAEFGNGTTTVHQQLAADALRTTPDRIASASRTRARRTSMTPARTARPAWSSPAPRPWRPQPSESQARPDATDADRDELLRAEGRCDGMKRSVSFNVQGFRVAVAPDTGEVRILKSVQAGDAGTVINPVQIRGQVEGAVAQAIGATLYEEVKLDSGGRVTTRTLRNYHVPRFSDVPRTEVHFADTSDALVGPLGAKPMSESPFNPVAPALANAIRDATGIRFTRLPLTRDAIWMALEAASRATTGAS